jgi:hypothetical protein
LSSQQHLERKSQMIQSAFPSGNALNSALAVLKTVRRGFETFQILDARRPNNKCLPLYGYDRSLVATIHVSACHPSGLEQLRSDAGILSAPDVNCRRMKRLEKSVCVANGISATSLLQGLGFKSVGLLSTTLPDRCNRHFSRREVILVNGNYDVDHVAHALLRVKATVRIAELPAFDNFLKIRLDQIGSIVVDALNSAKSVIKP